MHDLAVQALASGRRGGHRIALPVLVVIVAAVIVGWIIYARRARRNRGQS